MKKNNKNALWGVVVGSVVGSVAALLFAPKAGKELRKDIAEGAATTLDKAQEIASQASEKTVELYDKAKDVVVEVREWGKHRLGSDDEEIAVNVDTVEPVETAETVSVSGISDAVEGAVDVDVDAVIESVDLADTASDKIE